MDTIPLSSPGVLLVKPTCQGDERGFFSETSTRRQFADAGIGLGVVQSNQSLSVAAGTLQGLHDQMPPYDHVPDQLLRYGQGQFFDVVVDIRHSSLTYDQWVGAEFSAQSDKQIFVPSGVLHGLLTSGSETEILLKCSDYYAPECDDALSWNSRGSDWGPDGAAVLSNKDAAAVSLSLFGGPFTCEGT